MPYPFVTQTDVEQRLSVAKVRRLLDDDNNGTADATSVQRLIKDASSKVAGILRANYPLDVIIAMSADDLPEEIKRLTLDGVVAYAAQRHPEVMNRDWVELMKAWNADLKMLRNAETRLDIQGSPEPPQNVGGDVATGDPANPNANQRPFFLWGTGDF